VVLIYKYELAFLSNHVRLKSSGPKRRGLNKRLRPAASGARGGPQTCHFSSLSPRKTTPLEHLGETVVQPADQLGCFLRTPPTCPKDPPPSPHFPAQSQFKKLVFYLKKRKTTSLNH